MGGNDLNSSTNTLYTIPVWSFNGATWAGVTANAPSWGPWNDERWCHSSVVFPTTPIPASPATTAGCTLTITKPATDTYQSGTVLNGCYKVFNNNLTSTWFEYGHTPAFGSSTIHVVQGYANGPTSMSVSNLTPNTVYYFRIVSQDNATGSIPIYGQAQAFVTLP